jgi:hypothetical protein
VTDDDAPFGVGVGGVGELGADELPPPQALASSRMAETNAMRDEGTRSSSAPKNFLRRRIFQGVRIVGP